MLAGYRLGGRRDPAESEHDPEKGADFSDKIMRRTEIG
jgi:hypothetical protein